MSDFAGQEAREVAACPDQLPGNAEERAERTKRDGIQLAHNVRDLDPRQIVGRLYTWLQDDPDHLVFVTLALAVMVDPATARKTAEWTRLFGGLAALHPDYVPPKTIPAPRVSSSQRDAAIRRLHETGGHSVEQIARQTGAHPRHVRALCQPDSSGAAA